MYNLRISNMKHKKKFACVLCVLDVRVRCVCCVSSACVCPVCTKEWGTWPSWLRRLRLGLWPGFVTEVSTHLNEKLNYASESRVLGHHSWHTTDKNSGYQSW